jgi:adenine-specific DNA-methyltransferase
MTNLKIIQNNEYNLDKYFITTKKRSNNTNIKTDNKNIPSNTNNKLENITHKQKMGQFFSPEKLVKKCISLIQNKTGRILEPSCGNGSFNKIKTKNSVFIEIDEDVVNDNDVLVMDFFDYPLSEKFDTVIGNPPYVDNSLFNIKHKTKIKVQANLYLYFIEKCFHHLKDNGELIFIVPREFIKLTSARYVNNLLCENGTITHYFDYGDQKLFSDACPNVCIFRYEKGNTSKETETFHGKFHLIINDGLISFVKDKHAKTIGDYFDIKVGAVSGADKIFKHDDGDEFVFSKTRTNGQLKKMIYEKHHDYLDEYRDALIKRRIKKFNEKNWFMWGRPVDFRKNEPRIYVNCKTRINNPFFLNNCDCWDGSVLALFPKKKMNLKKAVDLLNNMNWEELGFMTGGRYLFSQKSLKEAPITWKDI